jgi:hypothetical protein
MLNWSLIDPLVVLLLLCQLLLPIEHNLEGKSITCHIDALNQIKAFAFSTACTSASTRDVCPVPDEINVPFFCKTIVFDLVFYKL